MNTDIFTIWFTNEFIPNVKKYRESAGKTGKVLLVIDNVPIHPPLDKLNETDKGFKVILLSPNETALLRPMDQGISKIEENV